MESDQPDTSQPDTSQPDTSQEASPHPEYSEQTLELGGREKISITGSNMFACQHCGESFTFKALKPHILDRHTERTECGHFCSKCEQTFPRRNNWIEHLSMCVESRQAEQHSSLPAVTTIRDPSVVSDLHQGLSPPELSANDLMRTNLTSKTSEFPSLENPGTTHDKDHPNQSEFGMDALKTPRRFPVPHTTTVGESQWIGHLNRIEGSETTEVPTASANANEPGLSAAPGSDECNNLDIIDQLDLLASRAAEATEPLPLEESSATTGSLKHREHVTNFAESLMRRDRLSRIPDHVVEAKWGPLSESLKEFLVFFGGRLLWETRSTGWTAIGVERRSRRKFTKKFSSLLENYAANLMFVRCCPERPPTEVNNESNSRRKDSWTLMDDTIELIHHYRANIISYFCDYSYDGILNSAYILENPLESTQQQSVLRWYHSFDKSRSSPKGSRHIDDLIHKKTGTAEEGIVSNRFDLVEENLFTDEAFQRMVNELRLLTPNCYESKMETMSQIVTSEFGLPYGVNTQKFCMSFKIEWDILNFISVQYDKLVPIATVVVLTGSSTNAQATTCGEYIQQNWPQVGPTVLKIIDDSLASESGDYFRVDSGPSPIRSIRECVVLT
jgi:hypothetical protein